MKKILLYCLVAVLGFMTLNAQKTTNETENFPMSVGPFLTGKAGVNTSDVPQGTKNGFTINGMPDLGITAYFPFAKNGKFGATLDLAYSNLAYDLKEYGNESNKSTLTYSYFTIAPNVHIFGFLLGLGINIPLDMKVDQNYATAIEKEFLGTVIDFRLGGMVPLFENETGRLNLIINGAIALTGTLNESKLPALYDKAYNPKPASLSVGFSYLFNVVNYFNK
jgi:hypothetical protein